MWLVHVVQQLVQPVFHRFLGGAVVKWVFEGLKVFAFINCGCCSVSPGLLGQCAVWGWSLWVNACWPQEIMRAGQ